MGYGATRSLERVAAAMGTLESVPIEFEAAADIPEGGVLLALPALCCATPRPSTNCPKATTASRASFCCWR